MSDDKLNKDLEQEADDNAAAQAAPRQSTARMILMYAILPLLVLILAGTAAYVSGALDPILPDRGQLECENVYEGDKDYAACAAQLAARLDAAAPGTFFDLPDLIVNLNSTSRQPRFLKIGMKLELESAEDLRRAEIVMPRIIDQFQTYLRELRVEDLRGSSGIYRLRIELLSRVKAAAPNIKVRDVLFQEILIQ